MKLADYHYTKRILERRLAWCERKLNDFIKETVYWSNQVKKTQAELEELAQKEKG